MTSTISSPLRVPEETPETLRKKEHNAKTAVWRIENRGHYLEQQKLYRDGMPEEKKTEYLTKKREADARWRQRNKDYLRQYHKKYVETVHPHARRKGRTSSCLHCGTDIECVLEMHHVIPRSKGGTDDKENKITLCANCHKIEHSKHLTANQKQS